MINVVHKKVSPKRLTVVNLLWKWFNVYCTVEWFLSRRVSHFVTSRARRIPSFGRYSAGTNILNYKYIILNYLVHTNARRLFFYSFIYFFVIRMYHYINVKPQDITCRVCLLGNKWRKKWVYMKKIYSSVGGVSCLGLSTSIRCKGLAHLNVIFVW